MAWRKSAAEVQARRDLKRRAVNAICAVADAVPLSASRGNVVPGDRQIQTRGGARLGAALHFEFVGEIGLVLQTDNAQAILTTSKGCATAPREARASFHYNQPTFYAFLQEIANIGCLGSYMEVAWPWAVQIIGSNSTSFPAGDPVHAVMTKVGRHEAEHMRAMQRML